MTKGAGATQSATQAARREATPTGRIVCLVDSLDASTHDRPRLRPIKAH